MRSEARRDARGLFTLRLGSLGVQRCPRRAARRGAQPPGEGGARAARSNHRRRHGRREHRCGWRGSTRAPAKRSGARTGRSAGGPTGADGQGIGPRYEGARWLRPAGHHSHGRGGRPAEGSRGERVGHRVGETKDRGAPCYRAVFDPRANRPLGGVRSSAGDRACVRGTIATVISCYGRAKKRTVWRSRAPCGPFSASAGSTSPRCLVRTSPRTARERAG